MKEIAIQIMVGLGNILLFPLLLIIIWKSEYITNKILKKINIKNLWLFENWKYIIDIILLIITAYIYYYIITTYSISKYIFAWLGLLTLILSFIIPTKKKKN